VKYPIWLNERLLVHSPLALAWSIDYFTKKWAINQDGLANFGPVSFELYYNSGVFLGAFSSHSPFLRVVSISTIGALLFCLYLIVQFLFPMKSLLLRIGLSILTGGILGNLTDRIQLGTVVDFISINQGPIFNVGDLFQVLGYFLMFYAIFRDRNILWHENNFRKNYWINPRFQLKYCLIFSSIGVGVSFLFLILGHTFYQFLGNNEISSDYLKAFLFSVGVLTFTIFVILFVLGKYLTHRLIGPLFAFEKYIDHLLQGERRTFKLRSGDEFKQLEKVADLIQNKISSLEKLPPKEEK
jgi:signal peptidase II